MESPQRVPDPPCWGKVQLVLHGLQTCAQRCRGSSSVHIRKDFTVGGIFRQQVAKHHSKPCYGFEEKEWTFALVDEYGNNVTNVFRNHGYQKGDTVELVMENRQEFLCI